MSGAVAGPAHSCPRAQLRDPLLSLPPQSAHLAMTDTLMMAYTVEMVSIEKVIACAQQYAAFFQASDLPYDTEDAVTYWINKVGEAHCGKRAHDPRNRKPRRFTAALPGLCVPQVHVMAP